VEFRILGPLELIGGADGAPVEAPKLRALLGVLLLHPNEVVSNERLIDELWGERPPATAGKIVHTYVSQLRRVLGADAIVTRPPGYLLHVESGELDAERFHALVAEASDLAARGDNLRARGLYQEALALWRGPPLSGVMFESFARNEVAQLDEERLSAVSDLVDCELALGQHAKVVAELETLVGKYPLRERPRAQLMLALYRCGRQADALAAYRDARRTLVEELGLEPGPELQELEKAILAHDEGLMAPSRTRTIAGISSRRFLRTPAVILAATLALSLGLFFAFRPHNRASITLEPNSVGFVASGSGRVTRAFPVGGSPASLAVAGDSLWVANYEDETVTRINRSTGTAITIGVRGHPTGITSFRRRVWVWTLEGSLVAIDPRYDSAGGPIPLASEIVGARAPGGQITVSDGDLWITAPLATMIRADAADGRNPQRLLPDGGVEGAIAHRDGELWVAGEAGVFPVSTETGASGPVIQLGVVRGLAFAAGSLWVLSGGLAQSGGIAPALRRIDPATGIPVTTISVGNDPVAVAAADGSIWVAARSDRMIERVDPASDRVVARIAVAGEPIALVPDTGGVWVATGRS
jgi:DNA-binding SARP family transcriptional activator/streptogramin lyase